MNYETFNTPADQRAQYAELPQEPRFTREQIEHAEFILSTRETVLELVK